MSISRTALAAAIHADNVAAGWWTDLKTGESLVGKRNIGELLCLVHSEITEAYDGWVRGLNDDKLTHRKMLEVELADAQIRLYDIAGSQNIDVEYWWADITIDRAYNGTEIMYGFMTLHSAISGAMEGYRKTNLALAQLNLVGALKLIEAIAEDNDLDLAGAREEKRAFNKTRADHQVANRRAAGGKQF